MQTAVKGGPIPVVPLGVRPRLESIDVVRGAIMVLMALDHVRDFFHHDALLFDPADLSRTSAALFFTRWVTHFCAPVFFFLAGTSAFLSFGRGKTKNDLARFLVSRGLWLVFLEVTVVRCLGWSFNFDFHEIGLLVIWALGWSMVFLAALIYLPIWALTVFALVMIAGHNLLDSVRPESFGTLAWAWKLLHVPGEIILSREHLLGVVYPLVPWVGVMAAGYVFGTWFRLDRSARRRRLLWLGLGLTTAFVVLRSINLYGDPNPWRTQERVLFTFLSFLDCEKYPPSLLYLLMTLGPVILLLALLDRDLSAFWRPLIVFGRVPLFFYLLHLPLMHGMAVGLSYLKYSRADWLFLGPAGIPVFGAAYPPDYGYALPVVYLIWLLVVVILYPPCRWFARVKQERRSVWLSYL